MTRKEFSSCFQAGSLGSAITIVILFCLINFGAIAAFFIFPESDPEAQISFLEFIMRFSQSWPNLLAILATLSVPVFLNAFFVRRALLRNTVNEYTKFDYAFTRSIIIGAIICSGAPLLAYVFPSPQFPLSEAFGAYLIIPTYLPFCIIAAKFNKRPAQK